MYFKATRGTLLAQIFLYTGVGLLNVVHISAVGAHMYKHPW